MAKAKVHVEYGDNKTWEVLCSRCGVVADSGGAKFDSQFALIQLEQHLARHARREIRTRLAMKGKLYA